MGALSEELLNRYMERHGVREVLRQDAKYHLEWSWLVRALDALEDALVSEGVEGHAAQRILTMTLYGGLSEEAAWQRIVAHRLAVADLMSRPLAPQVWPDPDARPRY